MSSLIRYIFIHIDTNHFFLANMSHYVLRIKKKKILALLFLRNVPCFKVVKYGVVRWKNSSKFDSSGTLSFREDSSPGMFLYSFGYLYFEIRICRGSPLPRLIPLSNLFTLTFHLKVNKRLGRHSPVSRQCHRPQLNERKEIVPYAFAVDSWVGFSVTEEACLSLWGLAHAWEIPF